jgi:hypothetical protein
MSTVKVAIFTLLWIGLAFVIYKFVFNPQLVIQASLKSASKCPDRWTFNGTMCYPSYDTQCIPFDPSKLKNIQEACVIAKKCQTDWSSMCL